MARSGKIICLIEPELESEYRKLCFKKDMSVSTAIRAMIIDELRMQGLLPDESAVAILKRQPELAS